MAARDLTERPAAECPTFSWQGLLTSMLSSHPRCHETRLRGRGLDDFLRKEGFHGKGRREIGDCFLDSMERMTDLRYISCSPTCSLDHVLHVVATLGAFPSAGKCVFCSCACWRYGSGFGGALPIETGKPGYATDAFCLLEGTLFDQGQMEHRFGPRPLGKLV